MKVQHQINIFVGDKSRSMRNENISQKEEQQEKKKNIFAGDLNLKPDGILQKKMMAQKQAMKVVSDAWNSNRAMDDDLNNRRSHIEELRKQMSDVKKEIAGLEQTKQDLMKNSGVAQDSEEQQDLLLLEKNASQGKLTEEENKRVKEIYSKGLTDYQSHSLQIDSDMDHFNQIANKSINDIVGENAIIRGVRHERLKKATMLEAVEVADEIKEAASGEIVGLLLEEAKDHVDEEKKEKEEKADQIKEDKKEQEALLNKPKEEQEQEEAIETTVDQLISLEQTKTDVQKQVQDVVNKMNLVIEDIKGAQVDRLV